MDEIKKRLSLACQEAKKYKELAQGLEETQIEKLKTQAELFRQKNRQKQELKVQKQHKKRRSSGLFQ